MNLNKSTVPLSNGTNLIFFHNFDSSYFDELINNWAKTTKEYSESSFVAYARIAHPDKIIMREKHFKNKFNRKRK